MNVKDAGEWSVDVNDNGVYSMWYTIRNLTPHTKYAVEIRGWNRNGEGPFNRYLFVKTEEHTSAAPAITLTPTHRGVLLTWNKPDPPNGVRN